MLYFGCWQPGERVDAYPKAHHPHPSPRQSMGKTFYRQRRGLQAETEQSALTVILKLVISGLTSVILTFEVRSVFSSRVGVFPFP